MGPDCGTSLIGGVGIGFANLVRRGKIGVIAAAGTGLQEFTCMVHNAGYGISHGIGTGGRDLSDAVGGLTTLSALDALEQDAATEVIVILSKPPGDKTLRKLVERIKMSTKPVVCCFLGIPGKIDGEGVTFQRAKIIDEAVHLAIEAIAGEISRHLRLKMVKKQGCYKKESSCEVCLPVEPSAIRRSRFCGMPGWRCIPIARWIKNIF